MKADTLDIYTFIQGRHTYKIKVVAANKIHPVADGFKTANGLLTCRQTDKQTEHHEGKSRASPGAVSIPLHSGQAKSRQMILLKCLEPDEEKPVSTARGLVEIWSTTHVLEL